MPQNQKLILNSLIQINENPSNLWKSAQPSYSGQFTINNQSNINQQFPQNQLNFYLNNGKKC